MQLTTIIDLNKSFFNFVTFETFKNLFLIDVETKNFICSMFS